MATRHVALPRHRTTLLAVSALLLATLPAWMPSSARAQTIPLQLKDTPRDVEFLLMPPTPDHHCPAGHMYRVRGNFGVCQLTINECLGIPGAFIFQGPASGNWFCRPAGMGPIQTTRVAGAGR